jgi:hypothetical protein
LTGFGREGSEWETHTVPEAELVLRPGIPTRETVVTTGGGAVLEWMRRERSGIDDDDEVRVVRHKPGAVARRRTCQEICDPRELAMSSDAPRPPVQTLIEVAMTFRRPGGNGHVYLVKGTLGPAPYVACCNVLAVDPRTREFAEPEVLAAETGTLTDLLRRVEAVLTDRHPGCQKTVTFDFAKGW